MKQHSVTFNYGKVVNINIVYETGKSINVSDYPTLENCLFGAVTLTKNADIDKYWYSGYKIGFNRHGSYSFLGTGLGRNVIIFGVDMSSSTKIYNMKRNILILGKDPTQGLEHTLSAEKIYSINFTEHKKISVKVSIIMEQTVISLLMVKKSHKFKAKDSEIVAIPLCLGSISKDWTVDNMRKTGLNGYVYDFIADYDVIAVDDVLGIHNYLMKKNDIV